MPIPNEDNPAMGYAAIIIAAVLWGLIGPLSRLAFQEGLAPLEVAFFRAIFSWPLFSFSGLARGEIKFSRHNLFVFVPAGLIGVTFFYGVYQLAIDQGGAALAAILLYTAPVWVVFLAPKILGEQLTIQKIAAVVLAILGVTLISGTTRLTLHPLGLVFGLLSGFSYALYYLFGKRFFANYPTSCIFFYALPVGALGLLPFVKFHEKTGLAWVALLGLSIFSTYAAYTAYFAGLRRLAASRAAILATLEPVVAAILAHFWWRETFSIPTAFGSVLILAAALLGSLSRQQP